MDIKLLFNAIFKVAMGIIMVGALLFIPAGSFEYFNGWLLIGLLFIPMFIVGIILMVKDPERLKKRLNIKEREKEQKWVIFFSGIMFLAGFIVAGLNYRYGWIEMPRIVVIIGAVLFVISYILYGEVIRENRYLSRTIEVQENQKVVDTGLYGIVRHPMYAVTIILFLSMPLILRIYYFVCNLFDLSNYYFKENQK